MREIKDLTVVICSYKANREFMLCLHQLARYGFSKSQLMIYENSPATYKSNREFLNKYSIEYIDNPDGTHAGTINKALEAVQTKYALLLDSDCFCIADPVQFIDKLKKHNIQLFGDICGDRAGYHIHKRVHPWWCFIDVEFLHKNKIQFVDFERMEKSNSITFIDRTRLGERRDQRGYYYDAGSTMYEDVVNAGGLAADIGDSKPYIHIEGASWRREFKQYEEMVAGQDNWVNMLYTKLKYDEKYLSLLGSNPPPEKEKGKK